MKLVCMYAGCPLVAFIQVVVASLVVRAGKFICVFCVKGNCAVALISPCL